MGEMLQTILLSLALVFSTGEEASKNYDVLTSESSVVWVGKKVTGEHTGTVQLKSGKLKFDKEKLVGGSFVMDMTTIDDTDLTGEWKDKLVGHLKSDDFRCRKIPNCKIRNHQSDSTRSGQIQSNRRYDYQGKHSCYPVHRQHRRS